MKRIAVLLVLMAVFAGCVGGGPSATSPPKTAAYTVSGTVSDSHGGPIQGVTLSFGKYGTATTDTNGDWMKVGLSGSVTVQPAKDGWTFTPSSIIVTGARSDVNFTGHPDAANLDAEVVVIEALVDPNPTWAESMYHDRVRLQLENLGGEGYFKVQFYGTQPNVINPPMVLFGETEVYEVGVGWSDTASWDVPTPSTSITTTPIKEVVVLTRNAGELTYRETARVVPSIDENL